MISVHILQGKVSMTQYDKPRDLPQTGISLYPLRETTYLKRLCFVSRELYVQKCFSQCYLCHGKLHVIILRHLQT